MTPAVLYGEGNEAGGSTALAVPTNIVDYFFFNDTATTEIYTLSLHDALPISEDNRRPRLSEAGQPLRGVESLRRSEEHTSELQSRQYLVCRLLLEKKKNI